MANSRSNYSWDEDKLLCECYKEVCQNPIIGRYQPASELWSSVMEKFKEGMLNPNAFDRPQRSIECRIGTIKKAISKLIACMEQVERTNPSGASESDMLQRAKTLYVNDPSTKSKSFKFDHVWETMKDYPQWENSTRKSRESPLSPEPGTPQFSINLSDENVSGSGGGSSSSRRRPEGVKKSKMKRQIAGDASVIANTVHTDNEQLLNFLRESREKRERKSERNLEIQMANVAATNKLAEATTMTEENKIMMMDLDTISDPRKREYFRMKQENIMRKNEELLRQAPPVNNDFGMYGGYFQDLGGSGSNLGDY